MESQKEMKDSLYSLVNDRILCPSFSEVDYYWVCGQVSFCGCVGIITFCEKNDLFAILNKRMGFELEAGA